MTASYPTTAAPFTAPGAPGSPRSTAPTERNTIVELQTELAAVEADLIAGRGASVDLTARLAVISAAIVTAQAAAIAAAAADATAKDVVVAAKIAPNRNTVVLMGDSITAMNIAQVGTPNAYPSTVYHPTNGFWTWAAAFLRQRVKVLNWAGVSGETSTQMLARFATSVVAYQPGICVLLTGTNDVGGGASLATLTSNVTAMLDAAKAANIYMVVMTIPPRSSGTTVQIRTTHDYNNWLKGQAFTRSESMCVVDVHAALTDFGTADEPINKAVVQYTADGVHPGHWGAARMGKLLADAIAPRIPNIDILVSSGGDRNSLGTVYTNLHPNPGFVGTSGTASNGTTGTVPNNIQVKSYDGAAFAGTVVSSVEASTDQIGAPWHKIVVSSAASKLRVYAENAANTGNWAVGDTIIGACEFKADNDWVMDTNSTFKLSIGCYNAGYSNVIASDMDGEAGAFVAGWPAENGFTTPVVFRTPPIVIPATPLAVYWQLDFRGTGTLYYRRPEVRKNPVW